MAIRVACDYSGSSTSSSSCIRFLFFPLHFRLALAFAPPARATDRLAAVERRLRALWADDARARRAPSRVLVFANRARKVDALRDFLRRRGVPAVALTRAGAERRRGSNHHLDGFLRPRAAHTSRPADSDPADVPTTTTDTAAPAEGGPGEVPHVLITTSLLSRGLDFAPGVRHVFVLDSPPNVVDFIHRAGRVARAGHAGHVHVFGAQGDRGASSGGQHALRRKILALGGGAKGRAGRGREEGRGLYDARGLLG